MKEYDHAIPLLIKGNLFEDVDAARWGGDGRLFVVLSGTADVVIDHNTAFQSDSIIVADGPPNATFVFTNNLTPNNQYGLLGAGTLGLSTPSRPPPPEPSAGAAPRAIPRRPSSPGSPLPR